MKLIIWLQFYVAPDFNIFFLSKYPTNRKPSLFKLEQLERLRTEIPSPPHEILQESLHATHPLKLLDKICEYQMDPTRTVGATERTRDAGRTDGRSETIIPPTISLCAGIIMDWRRTGETPLSELMMWSSSTHYGIVRDDSSLPPSQWETALLCTDFSFVILFPLHNAIRTKWFTFFKSYFFRWVFLIKHIWVLIEILSKFGFTLWHFIHVCVMAWHWPHTCVTWPRWFRYKTHDTHRLWRHRLWKQWIHINLESIWNNV